VHKRKTAERDEQQTLRATLNPNSATAKRLSDSKVASELADAKRRGAVKEGVLDGKAQKGKAPSSDYSKSAKFFQQLQSGGAKRKRVADADTDGRSAARFKL